MQIGAAGHLNHAPHKNVKQHALTGCTLQARAPLLQKLSRPVCAGARRSVCRPAAAATVAAAADDAGAPTKKFMGIEAITWQKIVPLGFMFFCILFNYTILRDTKVTALNTYLGPCFDLLRSTPVHSIWAWCIPLVQSLVKQLLTS